MPDPTKQDDNTIDLRAAAQTGGTSGTAAQSGDAGKFEIPDIVKQKYPDLIPLILKTESMKDEERQYWFHILPIMTDEQVSKLRDILDNEQRELAKIDREYESEIQKINQKHVNEWKTFEAKEKREKLKASEKAHQAEEKATEEDLLKKLQEM